MGHGGPGRRGSAGNCGPSLHKMIAPRGRRISAYMIRLTRLNGQPIMVNADLIESVEPTPDTVITLVSGNKLIVRDSMDDIEARVIGFKRKIYGPPNS